MVSGVTTRITIASHAMMLALNVLGLFHHSAKVVLISIKLMKSEISPSLDTSWLDLNARFLNAEMASISSGIVLLMSWAMC